MLHQTYVRRVSVWLMIFRRKYADMILNGEKNVEIRWCGTQNIDKIKPGDYILILCKVSEGIIGLAKVTDVCIKSIRDMTDEDAVYAGFPNKEMMLNELMQVYPIKSLDEKYYLIKLIPILDLRGRPVCLKELGINLTYNDIKGRVIELNTSIIERILRKIKHRKYA